MVDINHIYINNKNKDEYIVHAIGTNCTNYNDGEIMVRYSPTMKDAGVEYYREIEEFDEKFTKKKYNIPLDNT